MWYSSRKVGGAGTRRLLAVAPLGSVSSGRCCSTAYCAGLACASMPAMGWKTPGSCCCALSRKRKLWWPGCRDGKQQTARASAAVAMINRKRHVYGCQAGLLHPSAALDTDNKKATHRCKQTAAETQCAFTPQLQAQHCALLVCACCLDLLQAPSSCRCCRGPSPAATRRSGRRRQRPAPWG